MIALEPRESLRLLGGYVLTIVCVLLLVAVTAVFLHLRGFTLYVPAGVTR